MPSRPILYIVKNITQSIGVRLGLRETPVDATSQMFLPGIQATYEITPHLVLPACYNSGDISVDSAAGFTLFTCGSAKSPKRWKLWQLNIYKASGTFAFDAAFLYDPITGKTCHLFTLSTPVSTNVNTTWSFNGIPLGNLWLIRVNISSYTNPGTITADIDVEEEDAY